MFTKVTHFSIISLVDATFVYIHIYHTYYIMYILYICLKCLRKIITL